ncbi:ribonuclease HII [Candidatus Saccharibacteria bacterium]|nr:ribonuclease HII [Candidatus Saccharibacteria bacterium]
MLLGIDEVGRGPWAGPLVVGAVILPHDASGFLPAWTADLTDSKKLTQKKREALSAQILALSPAAALGWVSSRELDSLGMSKSLVLATRRAVKNIQLAHVPFDEIIIDGTVNFLADTPFAPYVSTLKKADFLIKEVSAASIIAKVARDAYMASLETPYPGYGFAQHVGYGTALHREALATLGLCPEHRRSFRPIAEFLAQTSDTQNPKSQTPNAKTLKTKNSRTTTKQLGDRAENLVTRYLLDSGHTIVARNHKTPFYEIDIISTKDDHIYFTEVKYRRDSFRGSPLAMVDERKQRQMTFAAESFLKFQPLLRAHFSPLLAVAAVSGADFHLDTWFPLSE